MSTIQSQQLLWQGRTRELLISSKQQPGSLPRTRPVGIAAGLAAVVLAALIFSLVLSYAIAWAATTRNGYTEIALRREIEDLRAQTALLRYQINLAESNTTVRAAAPRLDLRPADPVLEVDYVLLPHSERTDDTQLAAADPARRPAGLAAVLAEFATEVMSGAGGCAEASTVAGHRP